jgi:hypothetical protein
MKNSELAHFFTNCCYKCLYNDFRRFYKIKLISESHFEKYTFDCELHYFWLEHNTYPKYRCKNYRASKEYLIWLQTHDHPQIKEIYL